MYALVADDSGLIRSVAKRALGTLGFDKIDEAPDGQFAIDLLEKRRYDLVLTDWNMPHKTGLDVIKFARTHGHTCPIIMQTTEADKSYVMQAIAAGVSDYVLKPFNKEELVQKLERHIASIR